MSSALAGLVAGKTIATDLIANEAAIRETAGKSAEGLVGAIPPTIGTHPELISLLNSLWSSVETQSGFFVTSYVFSSPRLPFLINFTDSISEFGSKLQEKISGNSKALRIKN
jgi:hypothetical protein